MDLPTRSLLLASAALLTGALTPTTTSAVVLFDGKNNYVAGNAGMASPTGTTSSASLSVAYSTTTAFVSGGSYTGPLIYGGAHLTQTNTGGTSLVASTVVVRNDATNGDFLRFQNLINGGTRTSYTISAAVLFDSALAGSSFDADSTLTLGATTSHTTGAPTARWLVVSGGVTYVSSSTLTVPTNNTAFAANVSLNNPDEINWAAWTPGSDLLLGSLSYTVAGTALTDITRVGFYYSNLTSTSSPNLDIGNFSADLAAIPEPSSFAALAGLGILGACAIRRRRRA